jgi:Family of unknown function (DUF5995)
MPTVLMPDSMKAVADRVRELDRERTVADVAERLIAIEREKRGYRDPTRRRRRPGLRKRPDGVACFNYLYLRVTENVRDARASFEDPEFVDRLAVVFAEFYLVAYESAKAGQWVSKAWDPLFERRNEKGIKPIQFAIAGMNAHINNDLPWALLQTWEEFALTPAEDSAQFRDFVLINDILARVQGEVRMTLQSRLLQIIDRLLWKLDDRLATFKVARARAEAWDRGTRWSVNLDPAASAAHERTVGYTSHLILSL